MMKHRGSGVEMQRQREGGLKPSLCDTVKSTRLLMWEKIARTARRTTRNEGIITLIMSDIQKTHTV